MQLSKETSLFKKDSIADDINGLRTDVDGAIKMTVPVYYRSTTHSTPSISGSTSIGTSPTTSNAWEYVMPYPERDCYFYTCEQYTAVDGTKSYSMVRELNSETYTSKWVSSSDATYIDGGMLYTGSVTANKIAANAVTIGKLGSDVTDAIDDAEKSATDYISVDGTGITVHPSSGDSNKVAINDSGMSIYKGGNLKATYGDSINLYGGSSPNGSNPKVYIGGINVQMVNDANNYANLNSTGLQIHQGGAEVANFGSTARIGKSNAENVYIDTDSVDIRNGLTVLSTFTSSGAELGKESKTATIKMCGNALEINGAYSDSNQTYNSTIKHVTELSSNLNTRNFSIMNGNGSVIEMHENYTDINRITATTGTASLSISSPKQPGLTDNINASCPISVGGHKIITTDEFTTSNKAVGSGGYETLSVDVTKPGFTPLGIIEYQITGTNSQNVLPYRMYINGTSAEARVKNVGANSYTVAVKFTVLYVSTTQGLERNII